jgi:hypothetical protein
MVNEFYGMSLFFNFCALVFELYLLIIIIYNFVQCCVGNFDQTCRENYYIDLVMFIPTITLVVCSVIICYNYWVVIGRTSNTQRVFAVQYKQL